jgi:hypothetical protein
MWYFLLKEEILIFCEFIQYTYINNGPPHTVMVGYRVCLTIIPHPFVLNDFMKDDSMKYTLLKSLNKYYV